MWVPWTILRPSLTAKRWRWVGIMIGAASSIALLLAGLKTSPVSSGQLALAGLFAACCFGAVWVRKTPQLEISVSPGSGLMLRRWHADESQLVATAETLPARLVFAAPWLISLRSGTRLIPVWPDCLPPTLYRRVWVHVHWGRVAAHEDDRRPIPT